MCICVYVCLSNIYTGQVMNIWGVSSFVLFEYSFSEHFHPSVCGCVFLSLGASGGVEVLCCVVNACVTLGSCHADSVAAVPFCIPTSSVRGCQCLHSCRML